MKLQPFPVTCSENALSPWNIHRVNFSTLPSLEIRPESDLNWLNSHIGSQMSRREVTLKKKNKNDTLMFVKDTIHSILCRSTGSQGTSPHRLFAFRDKPTGDCDTILFINDVRFDLQAHTMVCDGYVLPLTPELMFWIKPDFDKLGHIFNIGIYEGEMTAWKQLLPAFVERCRSTWVHGVNCEYLSHRKVPITVEMHLAPLCSCGKGKDVEGMTKEPLWKNLAPFVTRVAISPLFAVSYLETVIRDESLRRCFTCRAKGKLLECIACKKVRYCSKECQKRDWENHKPQCKI